MTDPAPESCPTCGEGPVQTVLYPVPVHFRGSGFYSTDYGRGNRKRDSAKESTGGESTGGGESGGESKPPDKKAAEA